MSKAHSRWFARLTLWLGLTCAFSQVSDVAHFALIQHVRCAEHGELVHADELHEQSDASAPGHSASRAIVAADDAEQHDHDHCLVSSERRTLSLPPAKLVELAAPPAIAAILLGASADQSLASDVCAFAPKTSPPV